MLALDPGRVRRDLIPPEGTPATAEAMTALIFDRGASFPWRSDDPRLAVDGVIGAAQGATPELGQAIVDGAVARAGEVLRRLLENQRVMPPGLRPPSV